MSLGPVRPPPARGGPAECVEPLRLGTLRGAGALAAVSLGAAVAFLDATVVNVALRTMGEELDAGLGELQWVVTGYSLTLTAFILVAGSIGDRVGRRRTYLLGMAGFAVTSLLCAVAPDVRTLIVARVLQGVAGAVLTPGSLALVQASFAPSDRARAIGTWTGLTGLAPALGPVLAGLLLELSWRWVFAINLPVIAFAAVLTVRFVPESRGAETPARVERASGEGSRPGRGHPRMPRPREGRRGLDLLGGLLAVLSLGTGTYALVALGGEAGLGPVAQVGPVPLDVLLALLAAAALGAALVVRERRTASPMVPPSLFADRTFTLLNLVTLAVYAGLAGVLLLLVLQLQTSLGYSPLAAGLATAPLTVVLLLLAGQGGALGTRVGPRGPIVTGCLVAGVGLALLSRLSPGDEYLVDVLPGLLALAGGLALLVAPLTATVLASAPERLVGTASGVNNAVARGAGLLAVAALPSLVGLSGDDYSSPEALTAGYAPGLLVCAGLTTLGAVLALGVPGRQGTPGAARRPSSTQRNDS